MCVYTNIYTRVCMYVCVHIYIYIYIYIERERCMCIYIYIYTHVYIYIYTYVYIYIYIYIYTWWPRLSLLAAAGRGLAATLIDFPLRSFRSHDLKNAPRDAKTLA